MDVRRIWIGGSVLAMGLLALGRVQQSAGSAEDAAPAPAASPAAAEISYQKDILPFLTQHCFDCHGNGKSKADFTFDKYTEEKLIESDRKQWDTILHMLQTNEMPPAKRPRPDPAELEKVQKAIHELFAKFERNAPLNVGRVTVRRLNKTEYNNTIRDLVGVDFRPADDFPADDVGYGFDNIGDVLSVTPLLLEKYLRAAEQVLDEAIVIKDPPKPTRSQIGAIRRNATSTAGSELGGTISFDDGDYIVRARVGGDQIGDEPVRAMIRVDGNDAEAFNVPAPQNSPMTIETRLRVKSGTRRVGVTLVNPFALPAPEPVKGATEADWIAAILGGEALPKPQYTQAHLLAYALGGEALPPVAGAPAPRPQAQRGGQQRRFGPPLPVSDGRTRILFLRNIEVEGPFDPPPPVLPEATQKLLAHSPGVEGREAAREIVTRFATKAFRRPVTDQEVDRCLAMYDLMEAKGQRFELRVRAALYRVLVSPNFIFRVELDPAGAKEGDIYAINEYELASRLSYFLWNSMPDDELFALAGAGQLRANLDAQIKRMVNDPKSASFVQGFAEQWLTLRKLDLSSPDPTLFPTYNDGLKESMIRESQLFFAAIVREDRSMLDLLDAEFTFVDAPLARHYGLPEVSGKDFVRVALPAGRGGILTQASVLTLTSNATRTSPVKRGKFVLEQILNTPPPPPPDNVPLLEEQQELKGTLRQVMEQHRSNAMCASCHQRMDPIGFAFENYGPTGAWRDEDRNAPIDASGVLPDGRAFNGPAELKKILRDKNELFVRCLTEKMLTYALGRGVEYYDRRAMDQIIRELEKNDYQFSTLLSEIVRSDPFQKRTATGEGS